MERLAVRLTEDEAVVLVLVGQKRLLPTLLLSVASELRPARAGSAPPPAGRE